MQMPTTICYTLLDSSSISNTHIYAASSLSIKYPPNFRYKSFGAISSLPPPTNLLIASSSSSSSNGVDSFNNNNNNDDNDNDSNLKQVSSDDGIEVEIEKISRNHRRIRSKIDVDASLERIWGILTDYEGLADFIPGLAVSQVLDKTTNFARLLQIGQQNLAFGLKFNAKGIVDCYEKEFQSLPNGQRRDIEFKMIEGDFELFEGKWSIEQQFTDGGHEQSVGQRCRTTLSYTVDVVPKMWLPVQLVEGRLCKEIKVNLFCLREAAQKGI